jgi:ribosomal protein S18 acetylase RimI-like enzyme
MSVVPFQSTGIVVRGGPYYLAAFDRAWAGKVATWARTPQELFWLAPSTPAPLTAAKVEAWPGPDGGPRLFHRERVTEPLGYLELNPMPGQGRHLWLGHCVIRPEHRGMGLGRIMIELVLDEAFLNRKARQVSLMVFPDNAGAVQCYRSAGFVEVTEQFKFFATTARRYRMLQMTIHLEGYAVRRRRNGPPWPDPGANDAPRRA